VELEREVMEAISLIRTESKQHENSMMRKKKKKEKKEIGLIELLRRQSFNYSCSFSILLLLLPAIVLLS
jgi:hypothetical protein